MLAATSSNQFQEDLIRNKYHIFNQSSSKIKGYYPKELLGIIGVITKSKTNFEVEIGQIYSVRAFFAISEPIDNEVQFQSGYLDLKILLQESDIYLCEVRTDLPPTFILKTGSRIKIKKENILYKQDYNSV